MRFFRRLFHRDPDDLIDTLIAEKGAQPIAGMTEVDWRAVNRAGEKAWQTTVQAQRRTAKKPMLVDRRKAS